MSRGTKIGLRIVSAILLGFLYAPILGVVALSFNASKYGLRWAGFTTEWYASLVHNESALSALQNSFILALVSTSIATLLGTLLGLGLSRQSFPGKQFSIFALQIPLVVPDIVMAIAILLFVQIVQKTVGVLDLGMSAMVLAHVTFQIPVVAMVVRARRSGIDPMFEEAARDLGANPSQVFRWVTLPLLWPGVLSGCLLAFVLSLDDFVISFFTSGPSSTTLPVLIHASVRRGISPEIHALSSLLVAAAVVLACLVSRFQKPTDIAGEGIGTERAARA